MLNFELKASESVTLMNYIKNIFSKKLIKSLRLLMPIIQHSKFKIQNNLPTTLATILITFTLSQSSLAATLSASPAKEVFALGEDVVIKVSLEDAKAKGSPDLTKIYELGLSLIKQNYSTRTSFTNGKYTENISWTYSFKTKLKGDVTVPSISLKTNKGKLNTEPFTFKISEEAPKNHLIGDNISISIDLETKAPYVNQNFIYKITTTRFIDIYKDELIPPQSDQAIIEMLTNPISYQTRIKNRDAIVTDYYFAVTPIKAGNIEISAPIIRGKIAVEDNKIDPFINMNSVIAFSNLRRYEDFVVTGKKTNLKVKESIDSDNDWLPLKDLKIITRPVSKTSIFPGDALDFTITVEGKNMIAKQLPSLKFLRSQDYKIYSEAPVSDTLYDKNKNDLLGQKIFKFTLVPSKSGKITIPALKIKWFDINEKKFKTAKSKEFTLQIKEVEKTAKDDSFSAQEFLEENESNNNNQEDNNFRKSLYSFSLLLNIIFLILLGICLAFITKLKAKLRTKKAEEKTRSIEISKKDLKLLNDLEDATEIHNFCIKYFKNHYKFKSRNLNNLKDEIEENIKLKKSQDFSKVFAHIDAAIYGQKKFMPSYVRKELKKLLKKLPRKISKTQKTVKSFKLNP